MFKRLGLFLGAVASVIAIAGFLSGATSLNGLIVWIKHLPDSAFAGSPPAEILAEAESHETQCGIDTGPVQEEICAKPALRAKDQELALLFTQALHRLNPHDQQILHAREYKWLGKRSECSGPKMDQCIQERFDERIAQLRYLLNR